MFFFNKSEFLIDHLEGLTDIHNHVLPGIDDGSPDLDSTLAMIRSFKELGFKNCIATPHTMEDYYNNDVVTIQEKFENTLQSLKASDGRNFIEKAASEYMIDGQFERLIDSGNYLCLEKHFLLTELSYFQKPNNLNELVFKMRQKELRPILAHPERYRYIKSLDEYKDLKERGFEFQLNLLSLTDHYGNDTFQKAISMLEKDMFEFLGTDAHKTSHLDKIKSIKIKSKQTPAIKKLVENHKLLISI